MGECFFNENRNGIEKGGKCSQRRERRNKKVSRFWGRFTLAKLSKFKKREKDTCFLVIYESYQSVRHTIPNKLKKWIVKNN